MSVTHRFDIAIIGAGVVGLSIAFWVSELYDYSVLLIDKEPGVGFHQSMRSTGGVHRPVFEDSAYQGGKWMERSYHLWKAMADRHKVRKRFLESRDRLKSVSGPAPSYRDSKIPLVLQGTDRIAVIWIKRYKPAVMGRLTGNSSGGKGKD